MLVDWIHSTYSEVDRAGIMTAVRTGVADTVPAMYADPLLDGDEVLYALEAAFRYVRSR